MAALIQLEKKVRGKTSITAAEYEHWGDYDGPDEAPPADAPTPTGGRTKQARKLAALDATEEAISHRAEFESTSKRVAPRVGMVSRALKVLKSVSPRKLVTPRHLWR